MQRLCFIETLLMSLLDESNHEHTISGIPRSIGACVHPNTWSPAYGHIANCSKIALVLRERKIARFIRTLQHVSMK